MQGEKSILDEDGQLKEFYLLCDAKKIKGADGSKRVKLGPFDLDDPPNFKGLCDKLEKELGQRVFWQYQPFDQDGNLGAITKVDNDNSLTDMIEYIEDDAEEDPANSLHFGTLEFELYYHRSDY